MKNLKVIATTLKKDQYLYNTEENNTCDWGEPHPHIIAKAGELINVLVKPYADGRVYYTAFKNIDGVYYAYTHMKDATGKLILNCGGLRASAELKELLG
jgi:hypothetical protein